MNSVSVFLSVDRRIALNRGEDLPDRADGAVLFADISGFTQLTSIMASEYGPQRGAEEIAGWLNSVYGALIECVHRYQGSVVSFNGDAITCWFDNRFEGRRGDNQLASLRAVACAFAMQETMLQCRVIRLPSNTTTTLHIKVVVMAGPVRRFAIGRADLQRIDILAGKLLNCMNVAESLLNQDEIIVGEEIVNQLKPHLEVQEWRSHDGSQRFAIITGLDVKVADSPWPEVPDVADDTAVEWLWAPLLERVNMAQGAFLAELRSSVVVLFLNFSGIDYDQDDNARELLDRFVSWAQSTLSRYDGLLLQLTAGDKGSYLLATFGAIRAHEDDPARALEAALALRDLPPDLEAIQDVKIGISLGTLYAGAFGAPMRQIYSVLGREANVGARLMAIAEPGEIVVSSQLVDTAGPRYKFEELGQVSLKGVTQPRRLFLLRGKKSPGPESVADKSLSALMIGRSKEQAILLAKLKSLQAGQSSTVIIEGDPGIGKSQLTMAFLEDAQNTSLRILLGAGDAIESGTPYFAWRPVFRSIYDLPETIESANYQQEILAHTPDDPEIRQLLPLLNAVLPANFSDNELTEQMAGEARATSTRNLLVKLLASTLAQSSGLVLVLEDAHWLDSASWALAAQVRQAISPLLLVIVTRPIAERAIQAKEAEVLLTDPEAQHINLSTLSPEAIIDLVNRQLKVESIPQPVIDLILAQGEGNPFYSEQIAYALRDTGYLLTNDNQARLVDQAATLQDIGFPATIQGVITSRIDQFGASEQLTLKVASVIGRIFAYQLLRSIYPEQSIVSHLADHLEKFEQLDITSLEAAEPELTYLFRHIITQEVVYNLMTFSQRQRLHLSAARWYEDHHAEDLHPFYPLLAYHWRRANDPSKAIDCLEKAGRQALRDNANKEAIGFFSEIRELADRSEVHSSALSQATWARQLADGYLGLGDIMTANSHYAEAAQLLGQPMPPSNARLTVALIGQLGTQALHRIWPARFIRRSLDTGASLEAALAYNGLGFIGYISNETLSFAYATLKALNLAEQVGLSRSLAEGYATLCVIASFLPGDRVPELYAGMAADVAEKLNDPSVLGNVRIRIAVYHSGKGHWARAEEAANQAIAEYDRINDLRGWGDSVNVQLYTLYHIGRFNECYSLSQLLYQTAERSDNIQHQAWGLWMSGRSLIRLGRYEEAASFLEQAQASNDVERLNIFGALALAYWYQGKAKKALETIRQVNIASSQGSPSFAALSANANIAELYLLACEACQLETPSDNDIDPALLPELMANSHQMCKILQSFGRIFGIGRPAAWLYQGKLDWLQGEPDKARKSWQKSIDLATQLSMPYELARAHHEIGRCYPQKTVEAQSHLRLAIAGFEQLGAAGDLGRALQDQGEL